MYNDDCLKVLPDIPDNAVDMVLCDLPYGITKYKWDVIIPFDSMWLHYERLIKDDGAIVLFGAEPFATMLRSSKLDLYKYDWIWEKTRPTGFKNTKTQPMRIYENILVFSRGAASPNGKKKMKYYPQGLVEINRKCEELGGPQLLGQKTRYTTCFQRFTNYPKNILRFARDSGGVHPTQKPVALLEYLIKTYTNPGDVVLDNCMGSGSTGVACVNTGRKFIGIEKDTKYFDIAEQRINNAVLETNNSE